MSELTPFEKDVLNGFKAAYASTALHRQIDGARAKSREHTGETVSTDLDIARDLPEITQHDPLSNPIKGPKLRGPQLGDEGESILFFSDGYISVLEVYTHGDHFPEDAAGWTVLS